MGVAVGDGSGMGVGVGLTWATLVGPGVISASTSGTTVGVGVSLPQAHPLTMRKTDKRTGIKNRDFISLNTNSGMQPKPDAERPLWRSDAERRNEFSSIYS